jgi:uncharacterized glyoxalase superfamily protein PhnB
MRPNHLGSVAMIHEVFAYLTVRGAADAIAFYQRAFGAEEQMRLVEPGSGRIGHAQLRFGPVTVMLADEHPEYGIVGPQTLGGAGVRIHLHVDNADAAIDRAVSCGATLLMAPQDQFYGERGGRVRDPFGHEWVIGHEIEKVSTEEMQRRYDAMFEPPESA